ncbi:MAG TPA: GtrA family protein, partial [Chthoniobacterales bacterium]
PLSDPMSGFFVLRRRVFEESVRRLSAKGFKILLDIVLSSPRPLKLAEVPYTFRTRQHGESKLDAVVAFEYLMLLIDKLVGRFIPVGFLLYTLVGASGVVLHLAVLALLFRGMGWGFEAAQAGATFVAMLSNFAFNNLLTFRSSRLKGAAFLPGLALYLAVCGVGAICNVQLAEYLFQHGIPWWVAGTIGGLVGAVWNYAVSAHLIWTWLRQRFTR